MKVSQRRSLPKETHCPALEANPPSRKALNKFWKPTNTQEIKNKKLSYFNSFAQNAIENSVLFPYY